MFQDEPKKLFDYDDKSGHVIEKGSLRPDGSRRKDRIVKIAAAVEQRFPGKNDYHSGLIRKDSMGLQIFQILCSGTHGF